MGDSNDPTPSENPNHSEGPWRHESILSENRMFEALAHERRRYLLYTLLEDEEWSLESLAAKIAAWEDEIPVSDAPKEDVEKIYVSLYHSHVPKLVDLGIIEFDHQTERITGGPNAKQVLDVLEMTSSSAAINLENHARRDEK